MDFLKIYLNSQQMKPHKNKQIHNISQEALERINKHKEKKHAHIGWKNEGE